MNQFQIKKITLLTLLAFFFAVSCKTNTSKKGSSNNRSPEDNSTSAAAIWNGQGIESFQPAIARDGDPNELMMALSLCNCAGRKASSLMLSRANSRGVLPQVLVPQIRDSIAKDEKLKVLASLPPGLGDSLKGWLASDEKIATQIRKSIAEKMQRSLSSSGGTSLDRRAPFRLDLFAPGSQPNGFEVAKQAVFWNLTAAKSEIWEGSTPIDGIDHGLVLLENLRMAAEWTYIFGLGSDGKPNGFGGLALDVLSGNTQLAKPSDPSNAVEGSGLFSTGQFFISYPVSSSVNMATQVKEQWQFTPDKTPLLVQARIWRAAALAFRNYRNDTFKNSRIIINASDGALSSGVQKLPLVWLNGMSELLTKKFIDENTHVIREEAYGSGSLADLNELLALASAANEWRLATANIASSGVDAALQAKLQTVPDKMLKVVQLAVQAMISKYTYESEVGKVYVGVNKTPADVRLSAQVIALLASLENNGMKSELLEKTVQSLYSSHGALWVSSNELKSGEASSLLYAYAAANQMSAYKNLPSWSNSMKDQLLKAIQGWDR